MRAGARFLAACLVAGAPAGLPAVARAQDPSPTPSEADTTYLDAIVRVDFENGPGEVIPALVRNGTLLLPVRLVFGLAEVHVAAHAPRDSLLAILQPGATRVLFRPASGELRVGARPLPHLRLDVVWWEGELFAATAVLDSVLGVRTQVDWIALAAVVGHTAGLPVVQRARRESRRRRLEVAQRPSPNVLDVPLRQRTVDGGVVSWSFTAASTGPTDQVALDLGIGAGLLGGSAELRPVFFATQGASTAELRWSWSRTSADPGLVRQLRLGDVQSGGRRSRFLQGAYLTNAPFIRSTEFAVEQFVTDVPSGWEAELYEGGRLLAYADAETMGAFRVPLQLGYGQNPFELVLYGPGGETIRQARTIRVPFSRIPAGRLEYTVAGGRCRYDPCEGLFSGDARYGLSNRATVQGGWDLVWRGAAEGGALWQPYLVLSGAPLPSLGLTGEAVANGHMRGALNFEPSQDVRVSAGQTWFAGSGALLSGAPLERSRSEATAFWRPGWHGGALLLQGNAFVSRGPALDRRLLRLVTSTRLGPARWSFGMLHDRFALGTTDRRRLAFDVAADAVLMGPWRWLRQSSFQGQLAFEPSEGLTALRAVVGRRVGTALRMDAAAGWIRDAGVTLEVGFTTARPGPRFGARSRVSAAGASQAMLHGAGAFAWDPRTHLTRMSDVAALGRAGVAGVLFRDDNANGVRDPGEPGVPNIPVSVGGWPATTDADGRFSAWGMFASEPLQIMVDTLSFEDPQLVLPVPVLRVRPLPNAFGNVAVPVVVGAEISGFVVLGEMPLGGVPVVLREMNTEATITVLTFADGAFYRGAVPPGEYEVTLPEALLNELRADAPPLHIFVPPGTGEKRFSDLHLRLVARP